MSSLMKPWLVLAAIFIAGGLSGSALTLVLAPHFLHARQRPHDQMRIEKDIMAGLTRELNLTPDQQAKIQPFVSEAAKETHDVHQDEIRRVAQIFKLTDEQIAPILTPDQKAQLDKLESEGGGGMLFARPHGAGMGEHAHDGGPPPPGPPPGSQTPPPNGTPPSGPPPLPPSAQGK